MVCKSGDRYGRLTLLSSFVERSRRYWLCRCDCGNEKVILQQSLPSGNTKSCGCLSVEKRFRHGGYYLPEYSVWAGMKSRCHRSKDRAFKYYGGRGIRVCERWRESFKNFLDDMGRRPSPKHSLDRIDFNGNYEPVNCRWLENSEQNYNKRSNRLITFRGETLTETEWRKRLGFGVGLIRQRLAKGWTVEKALTTPSAQQNKAREETEIAFA